MGWHISWAHYNPAVTTALLVRWKISMSEGIAYMISQILWALVAVAVAASITWTWFIPAPGDWVSISSWLIVEILFTFALASTVLHTAATKSVEGNSFYGFAIGWVVLAAAFAWGGISWGAFNPAVGLWPWLYDIFTWGWWFNHVWVLYVVGPIIWGIFAGLFHQITVGEEK